MGFDLVTFIAQIVNLFVLVWLLKKFLYKPILTAVEKRQEEISSRVERARKEHESAVKEHKELLEQRELFETQKEEMFAQVSKDVDQIKSEKLRDVQKQIEEARQKAQADLNRQTAAGEIYIRQLLVQNFLELSEKALRELSDVSVLQQCVLLFQKKINGISKKQLGDIQKEISKGHKITLTLSEELPTKMIDSIMDFIRVKFNIKNNIPIDIQIDNSIILGISLKINDTVIGWHMKSYLDTFEENLTQTLETLIAKK
ncbi:MAG: hypothetical protein LBU87_04060 [Lactobacillales bacterium]|jgi:F-type H+-transporting ATPase subunit b|nr:hypothetical protein [Lactobacillales bacterium]